MAVSDPAEALEFLRDNLGVLSALVTDYDMPPVWVPTSSGNPGTSTLGRRIVQKLKALIAVYGKP